MPRTLRTERKQRELNDLALVAEMMDNHLRHQNKCLIHVDKTRIRKMKKYKERKEEYEQMYMIAMQRFNDDQQRIAALEHRVALQETVIDSMTRAMEYANREIESETESEDLLE